ncbi:MAG: hypothetical protein JW841_03870 [Deltaproteobacteria bacterium]|nr:hypothetical protein [Deltaproteobacteria bacterium]
MIDILKAACTTAAENRAEVFALAAKQLDGMLETEKIPGALTLGIRSQAGMVAVAMTALLRGENKADAKSTSSSDLTACLSHLYRQINPDGDAMASYMHVMMSQKHFAAIKNIIRILTIGADGQLDRIKNFKAQAKGTTGKPYYANAQLLGYFSSSCETGITLCTNVFNEQKELCKKIFDFLIDLMPIGSPDVDGKIVSKTVIKGGHGYIDAYYKISIDQYDDLKTIIHELIFPRYENGKHYEGPATIAFDAAYSAVMNKTSSK